MIRKDLPDRIAKLKADIATLKKETDAFDDPSIGRRIGNFFEAVFTPGIRQARGITAAKLMSWGVPLSLAVQGYIVWSGASAGALEWTLFCVTSSVVSLPIAADGRLGPARSHLAHAGSRRAASPGPGRDRKSVV